MRVAQFLSSVWGKMAVIITAIAMLGGFVKLVIAIDDHYAKSDDLKIIVQDVEGKYTEASKDIILVGMRLEQKILNDDARAYQQKIWAIEDRIDRETDPDDITELKRDKHFLELELHEIRQQLNQIESTLPAMPASTPVE
jgi:hypothetical protein